MTTGDFDNDKTSDVAFLIVKDSKTKIAVCLSGGRGAAMIIPDPYCADGISLARRGAEYYDFETDLEGRYDRDGVHAYCYEKAGTTYVYKDGGSKQSSIATKQAATINSFDGRRNEQRYSPHLCA